MCQCAVMTDVRCERPRAGNGGSRSAQRQALWDALFVLTPLTRSSPHLRPDRLKSHRVDSGFTLGEHGDPPSPPESAMANS